MQRAKANVKRWDSWGWVKKYEERKKQSTKAGRRILKYDVQTCHLLLVPG